MQDQAKMMLADLRGKVAAKEREATELKRLANMLCEQYEMPPAYSDMELSDKPSGVGAIKRDQFYGKPLASATRQYLEMRSASNLGAASLDEIFQALRQGGFVFEGKNDGIKRRGLSISLAKNTATFHRIPDTEVFGLASWYPNKARLNGKVGATEGGDDIAG